MKKIIFLILIWQIPFFYYGETMAGKLKAAVLQVIAEEQRVGGMLRGN